jgi:hypothetical protein
MSPRLRRSLAFAVTLGALAGGAIAGTMQPRAADLRTAARLRQRCPACAVSVTAELLDHGGSALEIHTLTSVAPDGQRIRRERKINRVRPTQRTEHGLQITRTTAEGDQSLRQVEWNEQDRSRTDRATSLTTTVAPDGVRRVERASRSVEYRD